MKQAHTTTYSISLYSAILVTMAFLLCFACANPIPPTGGPKDTTPPQIIAEESTPNFLTGFSQREIVITFDEWVQLKDQNLQIVISPPLQYRPDIALKGKSVIIEFDEREVLRERTTYSINFGASIADVNEGNVLDQYKFVFSTGTFIDSLQISGTIFNASTGEPAKQALILLHEDLSDSAFIRTLPVYFAKANDAGQWTISNIRSDTFRLYALTDLNLNYRYDQAGEKVGFYDEYVLLPDTTNRRYNLILFEEDQDLAVLDVDRRTSGTTKVILSGDGQSIGVRSIIPDIPLHWNVVKDTLLIWNATRDSLEVAVIENQVAIDTVLIYPYTGTTASLVRITAAGRSLHPSESLTLQSRTIVDTFNTERFSLVLGDSLQITEFSVGIDTLDHRRIQVQHRWIEQEQYALTVLPGGITDIFGAVNDSTRVNFQISTRNSYGLIKATITGLNDTIQYIIELVHPQEGAIDKRIVRNVTTTTLDFPQLEPQSYVIRIVEDLNENGRWDTGNFMTRRQPEHLYTHPLEPLRAGWDLEVTVPWQQKQN